MTAGRAQPTRSAVPVPGAYCSSERGFFERNLSDKLAGISALTAGAAALIVTVHLIAPTTLLALGIAVFLPGGLAGMLAAGVAGAAGGFVGGMVGKGLDAVCGLIGGLFKR